jgi:hypothetical protein
MRATQALWTGIVPATLIRDSGALRAQLDTLAWLSDVEPGTPLAAQLAVVHLNPTGAAAVGLAEALAARDGVRDRHTSASHVGLGWLVVAAALGDTPAAELVTAAHLRHLRARRAAHEAPDDPGMLRTIERCGRGTDTARAVRGFVRAAREGTASGEMLDRLIAEIDPERGLDDFLAGDPDPDVEAALPAKALVPGSVPDRIDLARRMLQHRLPWLGTAIDALCPPQHAQDAPTPPRPLLLAGPADQGQRYLVRALGELLGVETACRSASDLIRAPGGIPAAIRAAARKGADRVMLVVDELDWLDTSSASALARALETEGLMTPDGAGIQHPGAPGLLLRAETAERVPDELHRAVRIVTVDGPGPAYALHAIELLGTAVAIQRDLAGAWELPLADRRWADLRDRVAAGAGLSEILAQIEQG